MVEHIENLLLEHLRAMRGDIGQMKDDIATVKMRLGSVETQVASLHGDMAIVHSRMDRMDQRLERIERRQRAELDRRLIDDGMFPEDVLTWDEVKDSLRARLS